MLEKQIANILIFFNNGYDEFWYYTFDIEHIYDIFMLFENYGYCFIITKINVDLICSKEKISNKNKIYYYIDHRKL